jgi:hypothetical protein
MVPRFIATQAWVERHGLSEADLGWFGSININLADAVPAGEGDTCPRCRQHPDDCEFQAPVPDPAASTPEMVRGRAYVECLCRTLYYYTFVHPVDARRPVGESHIRAASAAPAPKPVAPPLTSWAPVYEHESATGRRHRTMDSSDVVLESYRQRRISPMLWESLNLQQRNRVARTNHLRQNQATDQPGE